jgi:hypothetical protein
MFIQLLSHNSCDNNLIVGEIPMAIFFDGATDNLVASVLNSIEWRIRYNILEGRCPDSPAFRQVIPGAVSNGIHQPEGAFEITSSPISGSQKTTISWYSDEGTIRFHIIALLSL